MQYLTIVLIGASGIGLAVQAATNARMSEAVQSPVLSALINFAVGGLMLAALAMSGIFGRGNLSTIGTAPWWAWTGGILGAVWVTAAVVALPKIGTAIAFAAVIIGQLLGALLLDTFGLLGIPQIPLHPWRIAGAVLMVIGILLMQYK